MAPLLILAYLALARREDRELAARFGETFRAYAARTPAFLPSRRRTAAGTAAVR
jgi:protein-S-isoprenylcysteine O-methyltransferase Ste14